MTDLARTTPITVRHRTAFRIRFPRLRIGATFSALGALMGEAFSMAYVQPYFGLRRNSQEAFDERDWQNR
jgi:hypothetical protein